MMIPASRPTITENEIPSQLSICNTYSIPNVQIAISTELTLTPMPSAPSNCFIVAPSFVRTRKIPITDNRMPTAAINIGASTACICIPLLAKAAAPSAAVARIEPQ